MTGFRFKPSVLTLDIEGETFDLEMTRDFFDKMDKLSEECGKRSLLLRESGGKSDGSNELFLSGIIDGLLGDGATERIFFGRKRDIFDLCDVLIYVCDECARYQKARAERYRQLLGGGEEIG